MRHNGNGLGDSANVTIRRLSEGDRERIRLLAQLEGRHAPDGQWVGAEVDGRVLAATSLETGETVADPFIRTAELRAMLELRVAQLRRRPNTGRRFRLRSRNNSAEILRFASGLGGLGRVT